jgi:hypothetical protein
LEYLYWRIIQWEYLYWRASSSFTQDSQPMVCWDCWSSCRSSL